MPKKLTDCVAKVKAKGTANNAWAVCVKSTGLKPHEVKRIRKIVK